MSMRPPTFIINPSCYPLLQPVVGLAAAKRELSCNVYHLFIHMHRRLMVSFGLSFPAKPLTVINFGEVHARVGRTFIFLGVWGRTLRLDESANQNAKFFFLF